MKNSLVIILLVGGCFCFDCFHGNKNAEDVSDYKVLKPWQIEQNLHSYFIKNETEIILKYHIKPEVIDSYMQMLIDERHWTNRSFGGTVQGLSPFLTNCIKNSGEKILSTR